MKLDFNFPMKCLEIRNMNGSESNILSQITAFQILDLAFCIVLHYVAFTCPLDQERNSPKSKPWRSMEQSSGRLGAARNNKSIVLDKGKFFKFLLISIRAVLKKFTAFWEGEVHFCSIKKSLLSIDRKDG